jgi:hypothetical protein
MSFSVSKIATSKIAIAVLVLGLPAAAAFADGPPSLDVNQSCEAAARGAISKGRDKQSCLADEQTAREILARDWATYNATHKTQCIGTVKTGGPPSYVELQACLEVMRDAQKFREASPDAAEDRPARRRR